MDHPGVVDATAIEFSRPGMSRLRVKIRGMDTLNGGAQIRCPHCRQWHKVIYSHSEGTDSTLQMFDFTCRGLRYYAG